MNLETGERGDMPAHIFALHVALRDATKRREAAEERLAKALDANIAEFDRLRTAINEAANERASAAGDQRSCFDAIRKLGFFVDPHREPASYSLQQDEEAARMRIAKDEANR